jgi:mRNA interferase MazF
VTRGTEHGELWEARLDKTRPVVIVSRDDPQGRRAKATVASVTSHLRDIPTSVLVDHRDGLARASTINCDELQTIPKAALVRRIGRLSATKLEALDHALRFALQLR